MNTKELTNLRQLVESYWCLFLDKDPHGEPPEFLVHVIDYLEREHHLLFNTESSQWHRV